MECLNCGAEITPEDIASEKNGCDDLFCCLECRVKYITQHEED